MATRLDSIREERIKKLEELKKLHINPYPSRPQMKLQTISFAREQLGKEAAIAGRVMGMRGHGAILFGDLRDGSATIQILFSEDKLKEKYPILKLVDVGDFLAVKGKVEAVSERKAVRHKTLSGWSASSMEQVSGKPVPMLAL